jgi:hypothetical protein
MRTRHVAAGAIAVLLTCALTLVGCTSSGGVGGTNQPGIRPPDVSATNKMSANEDSVQDIAAALRANEVGDPEMWAKVVTGYRPYPDDDPQLRKLRKALADNRADPHTIDQVTAVLEP